MPDKNFTILKCVLLLADKFLHLSKSPKLPLRILNLSVFSGILELQDQNFLFNLLSHCVINNLIFVSASLPRQHI